jgi:hypothetical protein
MQPAANMNNLDSLNKRSAATQGQGILKVLKRLVTQFVSTVMLAYYFISTAVDYSQMFVSQTSVVKVKIILKIPQSSLHRQY